MIIYYLILFFEIKRMVLPTIFSTNIFSIFTDNEIIIIVIWFALLIISFILVLPFKIYENNKTIRFLSIIAGLSLVVLGPFALQNFQEGYKRRHLIKNIFESIRASQASVVTLGGKTDMFKQSENYILPALFYLPLDDLEQLQAFFVDKFDSNFIYFLNDYFERTQDYIKFVEIIKKDLFDGADSTTVINRRKLFEGYLKKLAEPPDVGYAYNARANCLIRLLSDKFEFVKPTDDVVCTSEINELFSQNVMNFLYVPIR